LGLSAQCAICSDLREGTEQGDCHGYGQQRRARPEHSATAAGDQTSNGKAHELGADEKAIIFTESRRTQDCLLRVLADSSFSDGIVLFNGTNTDERSKAIYAEWLQRHQGSDRVTGSRTADMRSALVDYFRDECRIMIATEAGDQMGDGALHLRCLAFKVGTGATPLLGGFRGQIAAINGKHVLADQPLRVAYHQHVAKHRCDFLAQRRHEIRRRGEMGRRSQARAMKITFSTHAHAIGAREVMLLIARSWAFVADRWPQSGATQAAVYGQVRSEMDQLVVIGNKAAVY
jgi:hypothetical protein